MDEVDSRSCRYGNHAASGMVLSHLAISIITDLINHSGGASQSILAHMTAEAVCDFDRIVVFVDVSAGLEPVSC